ncbi:DoxX family protein [Gemmatimonas sp.]|uniref:DoxX family protein n=1 Tax=Gemmatimonas sp. TaxID=1962908 RepID=UPI00286CE1A6|nr:DoxX family protein [Gemmatimonas sp.]
MSSPVAASSYPRTTSTAVRWIGYALSAAALLFLCFDISLKLALPPEAIKGTVDLGFEASIIRPLGVLQLALLLLSVVPRTAPLGAILWTGYLGGAVATHVRVDNPLFSHVLFPVYVAALLWSSLWIRDARVRALLRR